LGGTSKLKTGPHGTSRSRLGAPRTLEGTVRSINGLIERLHQSFYFYLLLDVDIYVPIGYYTASLWLLLFPLIIKVTSSCQKNVNFFMQTDSDWQFFSSPLSLFLFSLISVCLSALLIR